MNRFRSLVVALLFLFNVLNVGAHVAIDDMAADAKAFLASLPAAQKEQAMQEFKSDARLDWHYVPKERQGLAIKELNKKQLDLLHALLDSALSQRGYIKATTIISLEKVLHELENKNAIRDVGAYYILFFGEPSENENWGWRFEGHHLSINLTLVGGKAVSGTPIFYGSNPGEVQEGPRKGTRPLAQEEDLGRKLMNALDDEQRRAAIFSDKAPKEIFTRAEKTVKPLEQKGIAFGEMNKQQGELLLALIKEYTHRYRDEIADADWKKIKEAGLENIYFAWAGGIEKGEGHYYRIQGPTFVLEYDNTQNDANHVHTVWRDFENDFGVDLLKDHYLRESHRK